MKANSSDPNTWLDSYGDSLYRYALMRLRDPATAEDLVQETLLAALKARQRFAGQSSEKTWLIGILKHKIIDYYRKAGRENHNEDIDAFTSRHDGQFDDQGRWNEAPSPWANPDQSLEEEAFNKVFTDCIAHLPERLADVFILREMQDLDSASLCKVLDISSTNNLWVMLSRARMRLRECLDQHWFNRDQDDR